LLGHLDNACMPISPDLYSEHPVKLTKIGDFYVLSEAILKLVDKGEVGGGDGAIVNVHRDSCDFTL
jgi:hypothetical protein